MNIEPSIDLNTEPNIEPNIEPNVKANITQNIEPNIEPNTEMTFGGRRPSVEDNLLWKKTLMQIYKYASMQGCKYACMHAAYSALVLRSDPIPTTQ